jgi:hypothetical protein
MEGEAVEEEREDSDDDCARKFYDLLNHYTIIQNIASWGLLYIYII